MISYPVNKTLINIINYNTVSMNTILTIHNYVGKYKLIQVLNSERGEGGTLAYKINIDGTLRTFEMNHDGEWDSYGVSEDLRRSIDQLITDHCHYKNR